MNKKLAGLLVLCVLAAGAAGFMLGKVSPDFSKKREPRSAAEVGVEPTAEGGEDEASPEPVLVPEPDYEKLWATHEAQEVVATVNGREQRWEDYFYFLHAQAEQIYNYFDSMGNYYGMALDWDDVAEGDDMTYAQIAVRSTEDALRQFAAIEGFAEENKVKLSADKLKEIEEQTDADLRAYLGEEASDEEVEAYRQEIYLPYSVNLRLNRANVLYQEGFKKLYGEDGKKYSDKDTLAFLEEEGYISANHILLMTMDQTTGEALDEEAVAEIEAKAKALAEELQGIKKTDALLRRFKELKEELCEDTGKVSYPDGYTFTPGTMVSEFEDACNSLEDYQVSDPVKSSYGYHIILRLPLDPEALLSGGAAEPLTARATAANMAYGQRLQEYMDGLELVYAPGVEAPDLVKYLIFPTVEETETVPESESEG